eukprot:SM000119S25663  [mRNA]  locus=s119:306434:309879:+ [translate_table: standard]
MGLPLHVELAYPVPPQEAPPPARAVAATGEEVDIPGLRLLPDFVTLQEEQELLAALDTATWHNLAKRRVQHYGFEFRYKTRDVDKEQPLGALPSFAASLLQRIESLPAGTLGDESSLPYDQLTVNEYTRGIGLAPHIDTHSAFEGAILSLSLAGPCVMEFRQYANCKSRISFPAETCHLDSFANLSEEQIHNQGSWEDVANDGALSCALSGEAEAGRRCWPADHETVEATLLEHCALYLPPRSLLILAGQARCAWHHYIPHRKIDIVHGNPLQRGDRRVSLTFRKVRRSPCRCPYGALCDEGIEVASEEPGLISHEEADSNELSLSSGNTTPKSYQPQLLEVDLDGPRAKPIVAPETSLQDVELEGRESRSTPAIERRYVHQVYDAIAPHFSATRFSKWPKVASFLHALPTGSLVADVGCGNGKYLGLSPSCFFIGCDISLPLLNICAKHGAEVLVSDAVRIPYRAAFFEAAVSIAVLHHLSSEQRRRRAIEELVRIVQPGCKVLITVWAAEQEDRSLVTRWTPLDDETCHRIGGLLKASDASSPQVLLPAIEEETERGQEGCGSDASGTGQEYFVPWHLPYHRVEVGGRSADAVASSLGRRDDKKGAIVYDRYYHVFVQGELERLAATIPDAILLESFFDKSNWCIVLEKVAILPSSSEP